MAAQTSLLKDIYVSKRIRLPKIRLWHRVLETLGGLAEFSRPGGVVEFSYDWRQSITKTAQELTNPTDVFYFFDGETVPGNPGVAVLMESNLAFPFLEVTRTSSFSNFLLAAPVPDVSGAPQLKFYCVGPGLGSGFDQLEGEEFSASVVGADFGDDVNGVTGDVSISYAHSNASHQLASHATLS